MGLFTFKTDARSRQYYKEIIKALVALYGISQNEALALINRGWRGQDYVGLYDLRYHRRPEAWAKHIAEHWRRH